MTGGAAAARAAGRRPMDRLTGVFVAAMAVLTLAQARTVAEAPWLLATDALVLVLLALLARAPAGAVARATALWYPFLLIPVYYAQLGVIGVAAGHVRDGTVQGWEAWLFGGPLSVTWRERMGSPALSSLLHLCYFAHYFVYMGVPVWLYARAGREAAERALFGIALAFFFCFLVSACFPVAGPWYAYRRPAGPEVDVATARLVHAVLDAGSSYGTAFPSSHVAASWAAVLMAVRDARRLAIGLVPVVLGLALGTVYGQFHYAVDALAGAAVAFGCWAATDPLRSRLAGRPQPA